MFHGVKMRGQLALLAVLGCGAAAPAWADPSDRAQLNQAGGKSDQRTEMACKVSILSARCRGSERVGIRTPRLSRMADDVFLDRCAHPHQRKQNVGRA